MMKKFFTAIVASLFVLTASAADLKRHTNLYDKIPAGYVGSINLECAAPGAFEGQETDFGFTTVHGFMIRPTLFIGGGAGYLHNFRFGKGVIPIFAEGRLYFPSQYMRRIYPHIGLRLGGQIATEGGSGLYSQVACGFRVPVSEKLALTVEIGPQLTQRYTRGENKEGATIMGSGKKFHNAGNKFGFFARIGLEF